MPDLLAVLRADVFEGVLSLEWERHWHPELLRSMQHSSSPLNAHAGNESQGASLGGGSAAGWRSVTGARYFSQRVMNVTTIPPSVLSG
jgi:hypothetical protein